ncbi:response regulator [Paenibacillus sp. CAU 1782]
MIEVLLVDDESYVTESLNATIPWRELGISHVHQAASPGEALAILEEQSIDILVTDIRMPEMNGLELIGLVKERWPHVRSLLLTGYSDFEYAKKAIQLKAVDYLLKPVNDEAFIGCLASNIEDLKEEWEKADQYHRLMYAIKSDHSVLRQNLMQELLLGRQMSQSALREKLQHYEIKVEPGDSALLMLIQLGRSFTGMDSRSIALMEYAVGNIAEEVFGPSYRIWHSKAPHDCLAIVASVPQGENYSLFRKEYVARRCLDFQEMVSSYLKGDIAIIVSEWFTMPEQLGRIYRTSLAALYRLDRGGALVFVEDLPQRGVSGGKGIEELYKPPTLIHSLESGQWEAARGKIALALQREEGEDALTREELHEAFLSISNAFLYLLHREGMAMQDVDPEGFNMLLDRSLIGSADKLKSWCDEMLDRLETQLAESDTNNKRHIVKQVQELVTGNLGEETSVKSIADKVFLHPVYLSKMYKNETGESLGDYIIRMRMERAVHMLKSSNKKMYEITTELGYQNPQYFSKIFKKHFGMTPQEYREKMS